MKKEKVKPIEQKIRGADTFDDPEDLMPIPDRLKASQEVYANSPQTSQDAREMASKPKVIYPLTKGKKYGGK